MEDLLAASSGNALAPEGFKKGKPKTFNCPSCGGSIAIKATGHTITSVCMYCSSVIDVADENFRIIEKAHQKVRDTLIPVGARGPLSGIVWEVVGYMEKTDGSGAYS